MKLSKKSAMIDQKLYLAEQTRQIRELVEHNVRIEFELKRVIDHFEYANSSQSIMERQKTYNSIILAIGYAGFFAIWAFLAELLPEKATSLTAFLVSSSLLLYVCWEIGTTAAQSFRAVSKSTASLPEKKSLEEKLFPVVWLVTTLLGLCGCLLLYYNAVAHFFSLPMWPN